MAIVLEQSARRYADAATQRRSGWVTAKEVLRLAEHADTDAVVDTGTKDDSPGDLL